MPTLDFKGKQFVYAHHLTVPFRQLNVDAKKSVAKDGKASLDDNLIIHGDNLHALKALLPKYAGKVKCIYIDPPYNTGEEGWCYNDNVNAPLIKEWLKESANPVDKDDLERHDKWLCMMWPRLMLLREMLSEDGYLLVSIDNNEQHNLRVVLDEIYGENNFLTQITWEKTRKNDARFFSNGNDYIVVYAKNKQHLVEANIYLREDKPGAKEIHAKYLELKKKHGNNLARIQSALREFYNDLPKDHPSKKLARYGNVDERGVWRDDNMSWPGGGGPEYKVLHPKTRKPCRVPDGGWRYATPEKMQEMISRGKVVFRNDHTEPPIRKTYLIRSSIPGEMEIEEEEEEIGIQVMGSYLYRSAQQTSKVVTEIFGKKVFDNPKDYEVLARLIKYVADKDAIILDSFAGSGTTAHAALALNKEDGGNRKFILVECEKYADEITAERVRRVIKGVKGAGDENLKKGLGGSFTFCELGDEINIENLLKGEKLPTYDELARYAFYTATGQTLDKVKHGADFFVGETANYHVHVIYEPDTQFLRSQESALNMPLAERISKSLDGSKKTALVFATHKFMGQKDLTDMGIVYCQLPYAIHRVMGD